MSQDKDKPQRKAKTLEDEIAVAREKVKRLEERQREQQKKWREKNQKSIVDLIRSEKLDMVEVEMWQEALPKLKTLLISENV